MKKQLTVYTLIVLYFACISSAVFLIATREASRSKSAETGQPGQLSLGKKDSVAIINILGPIRISTRPQSFLSLDSESITSRMRQFSEKPEVKAIILRINSPGGSVASVQEIYSEVMRARKKGKIVIASMGDVAASGGYYIASACDKIVANPGTLTGSIGVILELGNVQELFKKVGVKIHTVKSGKYKDSGSMYRELTDEERKMFQDLTDDAYQQFVDAISEGRRMKRDDVLVIADGRVFTGAQAKKENLVDYLGNDLDALDLAKKLGNIKGEPRIITEFNSLEKLLGIIDRPSNEMPLKEILGSRKIRFEYMME